MKTLFSKFNGEQILIFWLFFLVFLLFAIGIISKNTRVERVDRDLDYVMGTCSEINC